MLTDIKMKTKKLTELGHSERLKIYVNSCNIWSTLAFKSIQMTYSLKPLHPWFSNFTCSMIRLQGFRMIKYRLVGNQYDAVAKNIKSPKSTFPPKPLNIFA